MADSFDKLELETYYINLQFLKILESKWYKILSIVSLIPLAMPSVNRVQKKLWHFYNYIYTFSIFYFCIVKKTDYYDGKNIIKLNK